MTLLVSTIVRSAALLECSSKVYCVSEGDVMPYLRACEPSLRDYDQNSRGGMRGARGMAVAGDDFYVANFDSVFRYDRAWNLKSAISHAQCADIHDIAIRDGSLWVASTRNDRLFQFNLDGSVRDIIDPWSSDTVEGAFGIVKKPRIDAADLRDPRTHNKSTTDRLHLNSFAFTPSGELMLSLGQVRVNGHCESALIALGKSGGARVVHRNAEAPVPSHNVVFMPDGALLHADTANARVLRIDPLGVNPAQTVLETQGGYTRGLCLLTDGRVAVGVQNEVWIFDFNTGEISQRVQISKDPRESVHSIVDILE